MTEMPDSREIKVADIEEGDTIDVIIEGEEVTGVLVLNVDIDTAEVLVEYEGQTIWVEEENITGV